MRELCIKYNVGHSTVAWHMKREKWTEKRKKHCSKIDTDSLSGDIQSRVNEREFLIKSIENLVKLKLNAETRVLLKTQSIENLKFLASILNKSKNNIADLIKISELLKGNVTERTEVSEKEKMERLDRILRYRQGLRGENQN